MCDGDGGCCGRKRQRMMLICGHEDQCWRVGTWSVVSMETVREIDVCCWAWCISAQLGGDFAVLVAVEAELKGESLRLLVVD